jgi:hypothetical protein
MPSFKLSTPGSTLSGAMSFQDRIAVRYLRSIRMWGPVQSDALWRVAPVNSRENARPDPHAEHLAAIEKFLER